MSNDEKTVIRIHPYNFEQRENLVIALAHSGYKTWIEEIGKYTYSKKIYMCFEYVGADKND